MPHALLILALPQENAGDLLASHGIDLHYTGVGKVNAALKLTELLLRCEQPQLVINAGSAGSHTFDAGQVIVATHFHQRDMDATAMGFALGETPFETPIVLSNGLPVSGYTSSTCYTGDSFVTEAHEQLELSVIDMEAYALAKVCQHLGHRFICLKFITDGANGQAAADWSSAVAMAAAHLSVAIKHAVDEHHAAH